MTWCIVKKNNNDSFPVSIAYQVGQGCVPLFQYSSMTLPWQINEIKLDKSLQLTSESNVEVSFAILLLDYVDLKHLQSQRRV